MKRRKRILSVLFVSIITCNIILISCTKKPKTTSQDIYRQVSKILTSGQIKYFLPSEEAPTLNSVSDEDTREYYFSLADQLRAVKKWVHKDIDFAAKKIARQAESSGKIIDAIIQIELDKERASSTWIYPEFLIAACFSAEYRKNNPATCIRAGAESFKRSKLRDIIKEQKQGYWNIRNIMYQVEKETLIPLLDKYSGKRQEQNFQFDFDECWCSKKSQDIMYFKYTGNHAMHDVIVRTQIVDIKDKWAWPTWYYIEKLKPGQVIYFLYARNNGAQFATPHTLDNVSSVHVNIWSPETKPSQFKYQYKGSERDKDIKRRIDPITFSVEDFNYFKEDSFLYFDNDLAVTIKTSHRIYAPVSVHVKFINELQNHTITETESDGWDLISTWRVSAPGIKWKPIKIQIWLTFEDSEYVRDIGVLNIN